MPPEEVEATIERANEYGEELKAKGQKVQMGGLYKTAFLKRWGFERLEQRKDEKAEAIKKLEAVKKKETEEEKTEKARLEKKAMYQKALDSFFELPKEKQDEIKSEFVKVADPITLEKIRGSSDKNEDFFISNIVTQNFKNFLINKKYF
jgi:hypothetical protein